MIDSILTRPGNLVFSSNRALFPQADDSRLTVTRLPSGHQVVYGPHGRRILAVDPAGHPFHECEWSMGSDGVLRMVQARLRLDWDQWIGIKPRGLMNSIVLDLSRKPDWRRLSANDLRELAARGLGLPFEEVKFFYADDDLIIDAHGQATIRHAKDALYVLDRGTFEAEPKDVRFMACMGAMHWADIDFLPVVELFQSLLPGTGSAAFELIRGLYDDQNRHRPPRPLRYRGVPPYPSEAAYKLFSTFFVPHGVGSLDPFSIFMDAQRSHEVTWLPVSDPPLRYFDEEQRLCVTVRGGVVQKATLTDDPAGLSFLHVGSRGFAPCGRAAGVVAGRLVLSEGDREHAFVLRPDWNVTTESQLPARAVPGPDWRALFEHAPPHVDAREAYGAVLLYPEDESIIAEPSTQPFVADYLEDYMESVPEFAAYLSRTDRILIDGFDAGISACIGLDRPRDYRILYAFPAHAQKQAQTIWNRLAKVNRLSWVSGIHLVEGDAGRDDAYRDRYDVAYAWTPFAQWNEPTVLRVFSERIASVLKPGGVVFVIGPLDLESVLHKAGLSLKAIQAVEEFPAVKMHRNILPRARVKPGLTMFQVRRT